MILATINKPKQLLYLTFIGQVSVEELQEGYAEMANLIDELTSGWRLLADLTPLDKFAPGSSKEIGKAMELCDEKSVGLVIRIIPEPGKDIGMNILSVFHYRRRPRFVTCETLAEAGQILGLGRPEAGGETG